MKFQRFFGKHYCQICRKEFADGVYYVRVEDIDLVQYFNLPSTCFYCQEVCHLSQNSLGHISGTTILSLFFSSRTTDLTGLVGDATNR